MRWVWKIVKWIAVGLGALIVIAIVAAVVVINTNWFRDTARSKVNAILAGTFKGQLAIGRIQGSIWSDLILDDITLTYNGERIAHIERMRVAYGILSILHDTIDLTHLDLSGVELIAKQDRDGKWNAAEALASAHPAAPAKGGRKSNFRVLVREVSLGRASINVTRANGDTYAIENSGLDGSVYILKDGMRAKLDSFWGHVIGPQLPPADIFASLTYETALKKSVMIETVKIDTHDSHLKLTGRVSDLDALKMDLTLDASAIGSVDIIRFVKQWSPRANLAGNVRIEGSRPDLHVTLAMNVADAKIRGHVHADLSKREPGYRGAIDIFNLNPEQLLASSPAAGVLNASVRGQGVGTSVANFNGQAGLRIARLRAAQWNVGDLIVTASIAKQIATYDAKIAQGQRAGATSRGRIDFHSNPKYQIDLAAIHLDLQKLQNRRVMHTNVNLVAQVKGSGIKLADADATARVNLKRTVLGPAKIDTGLIRASIARGLVQIAQASISAGTTKVSAKGQVALAGTRRGDLSYNLKSDDLSPWMTLAGRSGSGKLEVVGRASGPFNSLTVRGSGSMVAVQTSGISIGAGKITYALAEIGNDRAHGRVDAGFDKVHSNVDLKSVYLGVDLLRLHPTDVRILVDSWDAQSRNQKIAAEVRLNSDVLNVSLNQLMLQMADGTWQLSHPTRFHKDAREISVHDLRVVNGQREITMDGRAAYGGAQDVARGESFRSRGLEPVHREQSRHRWNAIDLDSNHRYFGNAAGRRADADQTARRAQLHAQRGRCEREIHQWSDGRGRRDLSGCRASARGERHDPDAARMGQEVRRLRERWAKRPRAFQRDQPRVPGRDDEPAHRAGTRRQHLDGYRTERADQASASERRSVAIGRQGQGDSGRRDDRFAQYDSDYFTAGDLSAGPERAFQRRQHRRVGKRRAR